MTGKSSRVNEIYFETDPDVDAMNIERIGTTYFVDRNFTSTICYDNGGKIVVEVFISTTILAVTIRREAKPVEWVNIDVGKEGCQRAKEYIEANDGSYYANIIAKIVEGQQIN